MDEKIRKIWWHVAVMEALKPKTRHVVLDSNFQWKPVAVSEQVRALAYLRLRRTSQAI